jgi:DNA-binding transcriptional regulator GbsR (MarR family)
VHIDHRTVYIPTFPLKPDEDRFIDDIASLLPAWNLTPGMGRVFGYLLLTQVPVTVDQIAEALAMSRAGVWNAARLLERFGHASRYGAPGNKRALYAPSDNFSAPMLEQCALLGNLADVLDKCAKTAASSESARRLRDRAEFYKAVRQAITKSISELLARRSRGSPDG